MSMEKKSRLDYGQTWKAKDADVSMELKSPVNGGVAIVSINGKAETPRTEEEILAWITMTGARLVSFRVFAIRDSDQERVNLFGRGKLVGEETPPEWREWFPDMRPEDLPKNPKIVLDGDAGVVWGYQCWWGPEYRLEENVAGREVVTVPLPGADDT